MNRKVGEYESGEERMGKCQVEGGTVGRLPPDVTSPGSDT